MTQQHALFAILIVCCALGMGACESEMTPTSPETPPETQLEAPPKTDAPTSEPTKPPEESRAEAKTPEPSTAPEQPTQDEPPAAVEAARQHLAGELAIDASEIAVAHFQQRQFKDGCLELAKPGEMCTQALVAGYRVILRAPDGVHALHANRAGSGIRRVPPLDQHKPAPRLVWQRSGGIAGLCRRLTVNADGSYQLQNCLDQSTLTEGMLAGDQFSRLATAFYQYGKHNFARKPPANTADAFSESYRFYGIGYLNPSAAEKKTINDFVFGLAGELERK